MQSFVSSFVVAAVTSWTKRQKSKGCTCKRRQKPIHQHLAVWVSYDAQFQITWSRRIDSVFTIKI